MNESMGNESGPHVNEEISREKLRGGLLMQQAQKSLHRNIPKLENALVAAEEKLAELEKAGKNKEKIDSLRSIIRDSEEALNFAKRISGGLTSSQEAGIDSFRVHTMAIGTIISGHIALLGLMMKSPLVGGIAIASMTAVFAVVGLVKKMLDFDNVFGESVKAAQLTGKLEKLSK